MMVKKAYCAIKKYSPSLAALPLSFLLLVLFFSMIAMNLGRGFYFSGIFFKF